MKVMKSMPYPLDSQLKTISNNNMFNNNTQNNTGAGDAGIFNQFIAPVSQEDLMPKKDITKSFLITIFLLVILISVGAFFYLKVLAQDVEKKNAYLASFDNVPSVLQFESQLPDMKILTQRLKLLNSIYDSRAYLSQMLFPILESSIESSHDSYVYFNKFSFKKGVNTNLAELNMTGMALDYPTLYRQLNNFRIGAYSKYIKDFKLTGFSLNERGTVEFDINFDVDITTSSFLDYINTLDTNNQYNNSISSGPLYNIPITNSSTTNELENKEENNKEEEHNDNVLSSQITEDNVSSNQVSNNNHNDNDSTN